MLQCSMPRLVLFLAASVGVADAGCASNLDCSLNGLCTNGACVCDKPWKGASCETMGFATVTPASGKSLYPISDPQNTWNGPIVRSSDGKYHMYNALYKEHKLSSPPSVLHGVADSVTGPYNWTSHKSICDQCGENAASVVGPIAKGQSNVVSIWVGGNIWTAPTADGPFSQLPNGKYPGGNPAPIYLNGTWYMTNQHTDEILTTPRLDAGSWTKFADIKAIVPKNWRIEDPFLFVDKRGNWHVVNHAYNNYEYLNCASSVVSAHFFSEDGKQWYNLGLEPWGHTVHYDDGTSHTYTTLERPSIYFDEKGQMTHLHLSADLVVGDEGCANRTAHAHYGHTPCDNCKWDDHAGSIIIQLDV